MNSIQKIGKTPSEVFLGKGVLKRPSKFTGDYPCQSVISKKLQSNIFRTSFPKNTTGELLLKNNVIGTLSFPNNKPSTMLIRTFTLLVRKVT